MNSRHGPAGGRANVSGVAGSSCRQPETTLEVFRELGVAMQHNKIEKSIYFLSHARA